MCGISDDEVSTKGVLINTEVSEEAGKSEEDLQLQCVLDISKGSRCLKDFC